MRTRYPSYSVKLILIVLGVNIKLQITALLPDTGMV